MAEDLVAHTALPAFDTVSMDGWAVSGTGPWNVVGTALAGHPFPTVLGRAEAVDVATGAVVPQGSDGVVRREEGRVEAAGTANRLHLAEGAAARQDVRSAGEEAAAGDVVVTAGTPVTAPVLGLAAAAGHDVLLVRPAPTTEVLVLGDELLLSGTSGGGRVRDAVGPQAPGWVASVGAHLLGTRLVGDVADGTAAAIAESTADLVLTSGGTARGPVDQLHLALGALDAELLVDGVAVRPGHPMLLAALPDGRLVVGLPGNPLAAVVAFLTLAQPAVLGCLGRSLARLPTASAASGMDAPPSEHRLVPCTLGAAGGRREAVAVNHTGPAMLRGVATATALAVVPPGGVGAGDVLDVLPLPWADPLG